MSNCSGIAASPHAQCDDFQNIHQKGSKVHVFRFVYSLLRLLIHRHEGTLVCQQYHHRLDVSVPAANVSDDFLTFYNIYGLLHIGIAVANTISHTVCLQHNLENGSFILLYYYYSFSSFFDMLKKLNIMKLLIR